MKGNTKDIPSSSDLLFVHKLIFVGDFCWHSVIIMVIVSAEQNLQLAATPAVYSLCVFPMVGADESKVWLATDEIFW